MPEDTQTGRVVWSRRARRRHQENQHLRPGGGQAAETFASAAPSFASAAPSRSQRQGGQPEDRALYTCGCGHWFDALVSTSVDCPLCGITQAW